ncbi:hypothetical protein [Azospirillum largimobile]
MGLLVGRGSAGDAPTPTLPRWAGEGVSAYAEKRRQSLPRPAGEG